MSTESGYPAQDGRYQEKPYTPAELKVAAFYANPNQVEPLGPDEIPLHPSPSLSSQRRLHHPSKASKVASAHVADPHWDKKRRQSLAHTSKMIETRDAVLQLRALYEVRERAQAQLIRETRRGQPQAIIQVCQTRFLKARFRLEYALGIDMLVSRLDVARRNGWITEDLELLRKIGYLG